MRLQCIKIILLLAAQLFGQDSGLLTFREYIKMVQDHHPVYFQANLLADKAAANQRIARGGFDPKIEAGWDNKYFDSKNYYSLASGVIKVPTWYGIEVKAGYNRNEGVFLDDSDYLPEQGLWNAGLSVPLGRGFILDERRAELKRAELYTSVNEQEQTLMINDLLYHASNAYVKWQVASELLAITIEGRELAETRLRGTRSSFLNGDKAAIDTLESFISLQSRQMDFQKARQTLENATLALNNFLWINGEIPLELDDNAIAEKMEFDLFSSKVNELSLVQEQWIERHPELLMYDYKIGEISIEQRLAKEDLKPDLRVNYNPLVAPNNINPNNYKIGAALYYPIVQRKQRGKIQLNKLKIQETEYARTLKTQELNVKLDTYVNNINQTEQQFELLNQTVANYNLMLNAENRKLEIGESSIFLVNTRETKYLSGRSKVVELTQKLLMNRITYLMISGRLEEVL